MADDHKINLEENSKYRVAHDLMKEIVFHEKKESTATLTREYFLRLYRQCYDSVNGYEDIDRIVKEKQ